MGQQIEQINIEDIEDLSGYTYGQIKQVQKDLTTAVREINIDIMGGVSNILGVLIEINTEIEKRELFMKSIMHTSYASIEKYLKIELSKSKAYTELLENEVNYRLKYGILKKEDLYC